MRTIALEEHFVTQSFLRATRSPDRPAPPQIVALEPRLLDLGAGRIAAMDESGIGLQVLSLASMGFDALAGASATPLAREINDELASAIAANPTRFAGFAMLALKEPASAAEELERCVTRLGLAGAMIDGTTSFPGERNALFLDDPRFLPVFETAARLDVPIYLHPAPPPAAVRDAYYRGLGELGQILSIAGWGWHAELGLHTLRLIVSGLFDRVPTLQLIIGHMGEGLPYALARSSGILSGPAHLRQPVADYFLTNIHITTSGYFTRPPLECALEVLSTVPSNSAGAKAIDRMMFSVDYPFSPNTRGRAYLDDLAETLAADDLEKLTHTNAERLLKLSEGA